MNDEDDDLGPDGSQVLNGAIQSFGDNLRGLGPKPISTGLKAVDRAILGFRPAKMYVIGARPGAGKTALSSTFRRNVVSQGYVVVEFNLEMGRAEIGDRELAFRSNVNLRKIMSPSDCTPEEVQRVAEARNSIDPGLWWVYDDVSTMDGILKKCRQALRRARKEGKKIGLVVIDYIGLIKDVHESRQLSISSHSRDIKLLSKEMDCGIVALTQLNRGCEYREDKHPVLADIRESGSLEQDADVVAFIYRPNLYDKSASPELAELGIRKQRAGPIGDVDIRFNPRTAHFDDVPPPKEAVTEVVSE